MKFDIKESHICDPGLVRKENQDACFTYINNSISVFCVADGMGGHANGKRASASIVNGIREWIDRFYIGKYESGFLSILDDFEKKMAEVNQQLFAVYNCGQICGSTLTALIIYDGYYAVFSMGDSHIYRKRGFSFSLLMRDDTWQNSDQVPSELSAEEIRRHSNYDKLMRALGTQESFVPHRLTDKLKSRDTFLLCSDGIYKYCDTKLLEKICSGRVWKSEDLLEERVQLLRTSVIDKGAPDNLTAILISVK